MNILITGGAGYIGSNIYLSLFNNGFNPIIVDNFSTSDTRRISELEKLTENKVTYVQLGTEVRLMVLPKSEISKKRKIEMISTY